MHNFPLRGKFRGYGILLVLACRAIGISETYDFDFSLNLGQLSVPQQRALTGPAAFAQLRGRDSKRCFDTEANRARNEPVMFVDLYKIPSV